MSNYSDRNFAHNNKLPAYDGSEPILAQRKLANWKYGNFKSNYCGCSWISAYNACYLLGNPLPAPKIIRAFENQPLFRGLAFRGLFGAYLWSVGFFFKELGYKVKYAYGRNSIVRTSRNYKVGVAFYVTKKFRGHFIAFEKRSGGRFQFLNDIPGKRDDIRTFDDLLKDNNVFWSVGIFIK